MNIKQDIEKVISTLNAKGLFGEIKVIESLLEKLEVKEISGHAKQEAEKWVRLHKNEARISLLEAKFVIENLLKELEATERKLAEAEKVVEAAHTYMTPHVAEQNDIYENILIKALSDYEASKEYTSQEVGNDTNSN